MKGMFSSKTIKLLEPEFKNNLIYDSSSHVAT